MPAGTELRIATRAWRNGASVSILAATALMLSTLAEQA